MMNRTVALLRRDEDGIAMVMAVVLTGVLATLTLLMLTIGSHSDVATARGRHWVQSLHVAESGVQEAIAKLQASSGTFAGTFTGSTDEGTYTVTVTRGTRNTYTIDSAGSVRPGAQLGATRELRVSMAPPSIFKNAIYSFTSLDLKNNDVVQGDVWANQNVFVENNTIVHGSVTSATGYTFVYNGARVDGGVTTGGFDPVTTNAIWLDVNAYVGGNVKASVTAPPDPVTCGGASTSRYTVRVESGAQIAGNSTTWGSKTGPGTVSGTVTNNTCTSAPATAGMPVFTWNELNYDPATLHSFGTATTPSATAVNDFQAWLNAQPSKRMQGTFYINQSAPVTQDTRIDLTGAVITGDTTIVTNTPIFSNGTSDSTVTDAIVMLASYYKPPTGSSCDLNQDGSECAVHLKNNFGTTSAVATLVYSPYGPTAVKNNAIQFGAIYGDSIEVKNNQELTYDARVERVVGFGSPQLEITRWLEV